jgi:hypothetical protein
MREGRRPARAEFGEVAAVAKETEKRVRIGSWGAWREGCEDVIDGEPAESSRVSNRRKDRMGNDWIEPCVLIEEFQEMMPDGEKVGLGSADLDQPEDV